MKKLTYIQTKTNVANVLWGWGNGLAISYFPVKYVYKGHHLGNTIWICKGNTVSLAADETTRFSALIKEMEKELSEDPDHVKRVRNIFDKKAKRVKEFIAFLEKADFVKLSNKNLAQVYDRVVNAYEDAYSYGEPIAFVSKGFVDSIQKKFKGTIEEFHVLINPAEKSFLQREQQDLLKIVLQVKIKPKKQKELIAQHTKKYTWVPYDYGTVHYTEKHFLIELKKLLQKNKKELTKEYNYFKNYSLRIKREQEKIFEKLKINSKDKKYFEAIQNSYYLMDYKKEIFTMLHWYSRNVFKEIGKRLKLNAKHVQYILPTEMSNLLLDKKEPDKEVLEKRDKGLVLIIKSTGKVEVIEGVQAKRIADRFYKKKKGRMTKLIGRVAQRGVVKGKVRIILDAKKCNQMKKGEILITTMTSPDFMVAVKKARAIVTDEGGIICHAAIVSRELGIPCVVGTKNATQVLQDGDLVEVNANHGEVRRLK